MDDQIDDYLSNHGALRTPWSSSLASATLVLQTDACDDESEPLSPALSTGTKRG